MRASSSCRAGEFAGMLRFCYDQYSNASTEKLREVWRRKFRDLERTFRDSVQIPPQDLGGCKRLSPFTVASPITSEQKYSVCKKIL